MPNPVYIGGRRALVDLPSGDWICVDTNSIDSTDYLLGFGIENDVFSFTATPKAKSVEGTPEAAAA